MKYTSCFEGGHILKAACRQAARLICAAAMQQMAAYKHQNCTCFSHFSGDWKF